MYDLDKFSKVQRFPSDLGPEILSRDHSSIVAAKRWVGGVRKWQFLLIYSILFMLT